ncbi:hypothetical protein AB0M35_11885 [Micromonospora sp. NPDC051196]|uniref:hypothetical protein n=1 Tax=Micromonospora sp. NPDC051196 TaxID=3155281 RepID=UPI00344359B9
MAERIAQAETVAAPEGGRNLLRPVLWLLLIVSAATNATMSFAGANVLIGAGFGLVTLASAVALVVHHYRRRRG